MQNNLKKGIFFLRNPAQKDFKNVSFFQRCLWLAGKATFCSPLVHTPKYAERDDATQANVEVERCQDNPFKGRNICICVRAVVKIFAKVVKKTRSGM